ncbi:MAG: hypothetical protein AAGK17_05775 [Pseudomonadota bacterium]
MNEFLVGSAISAGFLILARLRFKDWSGEVDVFTGSDAPNWILDFVRVLLRLEPHFYVFMAGAIGGITAMRIAS